MSVKLAIILSSYNDFLSVKLVKIGCETIWSVKVRVYRITVHFHIIIFRLSHLPEMVILNIKLSKCPEDRRMPKPFGTQIDFSFENLFFFSQFRH